MSSRRRGVCFWEDAIREQLRRDYRIRYQESRAQWGMHVGCRPWQQV